jgi:two-component system, cell cycle sensor histidine kinase and response regulator CckA
LHDRAMQAVTQGILITDPRQPDNPLIYVSPGFTAITGFTAEEAIGRNCRFLQGPETDPAAVAAIREALLHGKPCRVELLNYRRDGSTFWNELSIAPVSDNQGNISHFVVVQTDVTSRRQLEEHYRQAQKMEAIGRLAGGVAHDFNNLLTVINGYSEVLLQDPSLSEESRTLVELIEKAGRSSAQLTQKLLTFSRRQVIKPQVLDLNEILNDVQAMIRSLIGEQITLTTSLDPALECIEADRGDVEQVIMNLVINSRDAMPTGGALQITTRNASESEAPVGAASPVRSVTLEISDTGHGMTEEVQRRIFEPFFTTKEAGQGTGLGLSVVHGVIKQNRGDIQVSSQAGRGTKVVVYWPATSNRKAPDMAVPAQPRAIGHENARRTILLVEDEEQVRRFSRQALTTVGYQVLDARDGRAALEIAKSYREPIHLLVTDVVMPKMGGAELAAQLAHSHPETKVLFVSGYSDDAVVRHGIRTDSIHFLSKPFSMSALAAMAKLILDREARHGVRS